MKQMKSPLDAVPSSAEPPPSPVPIETADRPSQWSRRKVMAMATGAAMAAGLGALDLFPWSRPRAALASGPYSVWGDCEGYVDRNTVCTPSTAYYGSDNCSGQWHKDEGGSYTCVSWRYTPNLTSCGQRNAWKWYGGSNTPTRRMCSDGYYSYVSCSGNYSNFSICRTAI
ncbi:hypothetical protein [Nonomuraea sediminis]|uniref:hypothetical protein n=1 Tax=Nonomuraea sediminis TaxID=2835864 RepID=UPI001BDC8D78|nr:hypothetical protein [Nonomuraea sediminis]